MRNTYIVGSGTTPVGEHWDTTLAQLATRALADARTELPPAPEALFVANAHAPELAGQALLGAYLASAAQLGEIEAIRIEAGGASGGAALRQATLAVASGAYDIVAVLGVEKTTDLLDGAVEAALALELDGDWEAAAGLTLTAGWALLMHRYMHQYGYEAADFVPFPVNAHRNAAANPQAQYRSAIKPEQVLRSVPVAAPIVMLDSSTPADGAAAVLVAAEHVARELDGPRVRIGGSAVASGPHALHARSDLLWLSAVEAASRRALRQANMRHDKVDVLDLSDQHAIVAALALEACGFAERGSAPRLAAEGAIARDGVLPLATFGGCKARGDAGGALGVYQVAELARQLRGEAGAAAVPDARVAFALCLGGLGSTAAAHVLIREEN